MKSTADHFGFVPSLHMFLVFLLLFFHQKEKKWFLEKDKNHQAEKEAINQASSFPRYWKM